MNCKPLVYIVSLCEAQFQPAFADAVINCAWIHFFCRWWNLLILSYFTQRNIILKSLNHLLTVPHKVGILFSSLLLRNSASPKCPFNTQLFDSSIKQFFHCLFVLLLQIWNEDTLFKKACFSVLFVIFEAFSLTPSL